MNEAEFFGRDQRLAQAFRASNRLVDAGCDLLVREGRRQDAGQRRSAAEAASLVMP
jgi:hypothetical protein